MRLAALSVLALLLLAGCSGDPTTVTKSVTVTRETTVTQTTTVTPTATLSTPPPTTSSPPTTSTTTSATTSTPPGVRPQVDNVTVEEVGQVSARMRWHINGSSDARSRVEYGAGSAFDRQGPLVNGTGAKSTVLGGLPSCTSFQARIKATGGGFEVVSAPVAFQTGGIPPATSAIAVATTMHDSLTVAWSITGADDVTSYVEFGTTTAYGSSTAARSGPGGHTATLSALSPNTEYHLRVRASSACGTAQGNDQVFRTARLVQVDIFGNSGPASFGPGGAAAAGPVTVSGVPATGRDMVFSIRNKDAQTHTWSIDGKSYTSDAISAGATFTMPASITLTPGTYTMRCTLHTSMTGTLQVSA
jgi:hypothetical protein